jgi:hypothetical protein
MPRVTKQQVLAAALLRWPGEQHLGVSTRSPSEKGRTWFVFRLLRTQRLCVAPTLAELLAKIEAQPISGGSEKSQENRHKNYA